LDVDSDAALGRMLGDLLPNVDTGTADQTVSRVVDGRRRVYAVRVSSLQNASGTSVGETIVLQDVTAERQREQRLSVLNRVLRHNLRNDLNVVEGYVGMAIERLEDDEVRGYLETAHAETNDLLDLGAKARRIERAVERGAEERSDVQVQQLLEGIREDLAAAYPDATITVDVPADVVVRADEQLLDQVFRNLLENALEHADDSEPVADVVLVESDATDTVTVEVRDEGPGVPEDELSVLETGTETALEHGSGLGLWLVKWGVDSLGGTVEFDSTAAGTTVTLSFPGQ
jgi:signal transduction histidine kinase